MTLFLCNRQRGFGIDQKAVRQLVDAFARAAQRLKPHPPWREITVILTNDTGIAPINAAVMGHAGTTDVITQRYEALPGEPPGVVGEIVVNVEQAWRTGTRLARSNWSPAHELALYLAHGCDHLTDADDATPADRRRMRRRERAWLAAAGVPSRLVWPQSKIGKDA